MHAAQRAHLHWIGHVLQAIGVSAQWVHHAQRERGWSNRWLTVADPEARAGVRRARIDADARWREWQQASDALAEQPVAAAWPALWGAVADIARAQAALQGLRLQIDDRALGWPAATSRWTSAIASMLHVQAELGWVLGETADAARVAIWLTLIRYKELCGQERAVGSALLGECPVDDSQRQWLAALIERQDELRAALVRTQALPAREDGPWTADLQRWRALLLSVGGCPREPARAIQSWFEACTQRIDALHEEELRWHAAWGNAEEPTEKAAPRSVPASAPQARRPAAPSAPIEDLRTLRQRLADQHWIDHAKAVLIDQGATEAQAHQALRRLAMDRRISLAAAARWISASGGA